MGTIRVISNHYTLKERAVVLYLPSTRIKISLADRDPITTLHPSGHANLSYVGEIFANPDSRTP